MDETIKRRVRADRAVVRDKGVGCFVVTGAANVRYLTGFTGEDSWLVVTARGAILLTDSRYGEQAGQECAGCKVIERKGAMAEAAAAGEVVGRVKNVGQVGVERNQAIQHRHYRQQTLLPHFFLMLCTLI